MKIAKLAITTALIFVIGLSLSVIEGHARKSTKYEPPEMPNFTSECQQLTKYRTRVSYRIDHEATARCVSTSEEEWRKDQV